MSLRKVPSSSPLFLPEEIQGILQDVRQALEDGQILAGRHVSALEQEFASYVAATHAVAVSSGTAALEIIFRYYDVRDADVLVPTNSFVASANAVIFAGGRPVLVDTDPRHLCLDLEDLVAKVSGRTKAVEVVHLGGMIHPQVLELRRICRQRGIPLVEDAAHAHGASIDGLRAGSLGDAAAFSFYPTKVLTGGEGGMITTSDGGLADFARSLRFHGVDHTRLSVRLGYNWRMHEIAAVLIRKQLARVEQFVDQRGRIAEMYYHGLSSTAGVRCMPPASHIRHSYYKFPIVLADRAERDRLKQTLREAYGIETTTIYDPPIHLQPYYRELMPEVILPKSEILHRVLCLPMHCRLSEDDVRYVLEAVNARIAPA